MEMRYIKLKLSVLLLVFVSLPVLRAQQANPATVGQAAGSGGTVCYTVGQVFYLTHSAATGSIAQGIQQPYEISVLSGIQEVPGITLTCSVYPNPVSDLLILRMESDDLNKLSALLFDMNGKLIETTKIRSQETELMMGHRVAGTYFLKVVQNQKGVKSFKIIKN